MSLSVVIWQDQRRSGTFPEAEPYLGIGFSRVLRLISTGIDLVRRFNSKIYTKQNRDDYCPISFQAQIYPFWLQERGKMSYYHIFCALLAEQNCQHIIVIYARFVGSVLGRYLRAARFLVSLQQLVRFFFFFARKLTYFLLSTPIQKDTGRRSVPWSGKSITRVRKIIR